MVDFTNNDTKNLMRLLTKFHQVQLIKSPTRTTATTKTVINHIITNRPASVSKSGVLSCDISDHDAVFMIKHMRLPKLKAPPKHLNIKNYKSLTSKPLKFMINVPFDEIKYISSDSNEIWNLWKRFFPDILNKHAPITNIRFKGSKIPYVTSELKAMIRQRDYLRAKAKKTGYSVLICLYGQVRAKVNHRLYIFRKNYYTSKIEQHKYDLKNTWKVLKDAVGKTHKTIEIEKISFEGKEFTDKKQITELCNEHFVSVGDKLAQSIQPSDEQSPTAHIKTATVEFKFRPVLVLQVMKVIKKNL